STPRPFDEPPHCGKHPLVLGLPSGLKLLEHTVTDPELLRKLVLGETTAAALGSQPLPEAHLPGEGVIPQEAEDGRDVGDLRFFPADLPADHRIDVDPKLGGYLLLEKAALEALGSQMISERPELRRVLGRQGLGGNEREVAKTQRSLTTAAAWSTSRLICRCARCGWARAGSRRGAPASS